MRIAGISPFPFSFSLSLPFLFLSLFPYFFSVLELHQHQKFAATTGGEEGLLKNLNHLEIAPAPFGEDAAKATAGRVEDVVGQQARHLRDRPAEEDALPKREGGERGEEAEGTRGGCADLRRLRRIF